METTNIKRLTATEIAEHFHVTAKLVNRVLVELGYMRPAANGGYILEKDNFGEQCLTKNNSKPYIRWNELILKNTIFKRTLDEMSKVSEESVSEKVEQVVQPVIQEEPKVEEVKEKVPFKFDRGTFKAEFRTADGHYVRSKAEAIIDNYLYANGIVHAYERRLPIEEEVYTDFFIPVHNIYIEYWGYENDPKYLNRKAKKQQIYKEHGLKLIELNEDDVKNIDDILPLKLLKYGVQF